MVLPVNGGDRGLGSISRCCSCSCASLAYRGLVAMHSPDAAVDLAALGLNRMFKEGMPREDAHQHRARKTHADLIEKLKAGRREEGAA